MTETIIKQSIPSIEQSHHEPHLNKGVCICMCDRCIVQDKKHKYPTCICPECRCDENGILK